MNFFSKKCTRRRSYKNGDPKFLITSISFIFSSLFIMLLTFSPYYVISKTDVGRSIGCGPSIGMTTFQKAISNYGMIIAVLACLSVGFQVIVIYFEVPRYLYVIFAFSTHCCMVFIIAGSFLLFFSHNFILVDQSEKGYAILCSPLISPYEGNYPGEFAKTYILFSPDQLNSSVSSIMCSNISRPINNLQKFCPTNFEQITNLPFYSHNSTLITCLVSNSTFSSSLLNICYEEGWLFSRSKFFFLDFIIAIFAYGLFHSMIGVASRYHYAFPNTNKIPIWCC